MRSLLSGNFLLSSLWVLPAAGLLAFASHRFVENRRPVPVPEPVPLKVPIQVISPDQDPGVIYVELETRTVPEPSVLLFIPASVAVLFRRHR